MLLICLWISVQLQHEPPTVSNNIYRIIAIDPGTVTLGFAVVDVNIDDLSIIVEDVFTFNAGKYFKTKDQYKEIFGSRTSRLNFLSERIYEQLAKYEPDCVIAESSYLAVNVTSFASLIECKVFIQDAVIKYDEALPLELIDPLTVKYGIGALKRLTKEELKLRRKNKNKVKPVDTKLAVRNKLESLIDLLWQTGLPPLQYLDEHSVDAISIGYWKASQVLEFIMADNQNYEDFKNSLNKG